MSRRRGTGVMGWQSSTQLWSPTQEETETETETQTETSRC